MCVCARLYVHNCVHEREKEFQSHTCNVFCTLCQYLILVDFEGYRPVFIPSDAASRFEEVASPNTRKNIETCGILAGKLVRGRCISLHLCTCRACERARMYNFGGGFFVSLYQHVQVSVSVGMYTVL